MLEPVCIIRSCCCFMRILITISQRINFTIQLRWGRVSIMPWTLVCLCTCMVDSLTDDVDSVAVVLWQPLFGYIMNLSGSLSLNVLGWSLILTHCRGECGGNRSWVILRRCSGFRLEGLRVTRENRGGCLFYHVPARQLSRELYCIISVHPSGI